MAATAGGGLVPGDPRPNPRDDAPRPQSPPGKGKPVALADITNTGKRNTTRSVSVADLVKENARLVQLLQEFKRTSELSRVEREKLLSALHASRQQNLQLAQANSQMLAELNLGKDRIKTLQHELSCTAALLKVKDSELKKKNKAVNQRLEEVDSRDVMKAVPSKVAAAAVPSNTGCQEPPKDITTKRGRNKRKFESSQCLKDTNIMQDNHRPNLQSDISLDHEDPRKPTRRSTRLNPESCEVTEAPHSKLPQDDVVPSAPSSFIVQKQHGPTTGKDLRKSLQIEHSHEGQLACGFKKTEMNDEPRKEANLKEIQEAYSILPGIEAHQSGDTAANTQQRHSARPRTRSSLPFNMVEPPKVLEDTGNRPRRKSARLGSVLSENMSASETPHEDDISLLPLSNSNALTGQTKNQKQAGGCSSTKAVEGGAGRRSLRLAAEKVVSYKEVPVNAKMRRP